MTINKDAVTVVTHSGNFHVDEVFACATLLLALSDKKVTISRSRDFEVINVADIVIDVGEEYNPSQGRFDHHQSGGAGVRMNGIPYASFGLLWKEFGLQLAGNQEAFERIDKDMVAPIDAGDNGIEIVNLKFDISPYKASSIMGAFNASWNEPEPLLINEKNFFKMLEWAKETLQREILHAKDFVLAKSLTMEKYQQAEDKRIVILDGAYPADEVLQKYPEPLYVVRPRQDGRWGVKCVRKEEHGFTNRKDLPLAWAGLRDEALREITGVKDAIFCHTARFLALAETKEGALALAKIAVES